MRDVRSHLAAHVTQSEHLIAAPQNLREARVSASHGVAGIVDGLGHCVFA